MNRTTITLATAALSLAVLTACVPEDLDTGSQTTTTSGPASHTWLAPTSRAPITAAKADPYSSTGTWLVPAEIAPGNYRVTLQGKTGYWATCRDYACAVGDGMIDNDFMRGPGLLSIGADAVAVQLRGVTLTRMDGQ